MLPRVEPCLSLSVETQGGRFHPAESVQLCSGEQSPKRATIKAFRADFLTKSNFRSRPRFIQNAKDRRLAKPGSAGADALKAARGETSPPLR